jgi:hypothetical protein
MSVNVPPPVCRHPVYVFEGPAALAVAATVVARRATVATMMAIRRMRLVMPVLLG